MSMPDALASTIDDMIALLEEGQHRAFLERHAEPMQVHAFKTKGMFDRVVQQFEARGEALLAALQTARSETPTIDAESNRAVFSLPTPQRDLVFIHFGEGWFLLN